MKWFFVCVASAAIAVMLPASAAFAQDKEEPKEKIEKPALGDKEELVIQNKRFLKVRNETKSTLTIFLQFRTLKDAAWTWVPASPATSTEAISFEVEAGMEMDVKHEGEPMTASRMRIWATSATHKWLYFKDRDVWLVPEKNDDGEHIYTSEMVETFTFAFARTKAKDETLFDETAGERTYPTEGDEIPPPPEVIPWDDVPPGFPIIRNLSVLPVQVIGSNAIIRVKNLGHFNLNVERHVMLQRIAPLSFPVEIGHVGPLFHYGVKTIYLVNLKPGEYRVFLSPGDDFPYDFNDKRLFIITPKTEPDVAVLPVSVVGDKVFIKVKNVGTDKLLPGTKLMVMKLPKGAPIDHGPIAPLPVNAVQAIPAFSLPAGLYRAFVSPGDPKPYHFNDDKVFNVAAATHVDLDIVAVLVAGNDFTVKIKNIGTADAPPGQALLVRKLPKGLPMKLVPVGAVPVGVVKTYGKFPLAGGHYRVYLEPGDKGPYDGNDSEEFNIASHANLAVLPVDVKGDEVTILVKNVGPGDAAPGQHLFVRKLPMGKPMDHGPVGGLDAGKTKPFPKFKLPPGEYRAYLDPGEKPPYSGNDHDDFKVGMVVVEADLEVSQPMLAGLKVKGVIKNNGPGKYKGKREWHIEKLVGMKWQPVPTVGSNVIGPLNPGDTLPIEGGYMGKGMYRIRISPLDTIPGNDMKMKALP